MGCTTSKAEDTLTPVDAPSTPSAPSAPVAAAAAEPSVEKQATPGSASLLDPGEVVNKRMSVNYQAKELDEKRSSTSSERRSSAPFDKARVGTHTRHGVMPGPRGIANAKINQDRGVVCWPFHGTLNEAVLCVFDGHGPKGEKASEFCMKTLPQLLEADHAALLADPARRAPRARPDALRRAARVSVGAGVDRRPPTAACSCAAGRMPHTQHHPTRPHVPHGRVQEHSDVVR